MFVDVIANCYFISCRQIPTCISAINDAHWYYNVFVDGIANGYYKFVVKFKHAGVVPSMSFFSSLTDFNATTTQKCEHIKYYPAPFDSFRVFNFKANTTRPKTLHFD